MFPQKEKKKKAVIEGFLSTDVKERLFLSDLEYPAII